MQEGLYVTLTGDGRIKKHLSTIFGEMPQDESSIGDELIRFSEKVLPMNLERDPQWVMAKVQEIETNPMIYMDFQEIFKSYLIMMMEHDPVHSTLSRTKLEDEVPPPARDVTLLKENILTSLACLTAVNTAQILTNHVLNSLCQRKQIRAKTRHINLYKTHVTTVFTLDEELRTQYLFRSEDTYYYFLLQHFLASKPNVARCEFCGRVFLPKTRKKTKYCYRIVRNGRPCNEVAPQLSRRERAAAVRVIAEYNRIKDMLLHRLDRVTYDKKPSPIDLTRQEYYQWQDKANDARDRYLAGTLSEEDALRIIHVPTIHELREQDSAELTVANSGMES